jgi:hypothetical protein
MNTSRNKAIGAIAAAVGILLPGVALSNVRVDGSHQAKTLDCAGGSARIAGSHNKVTLTGGCTRLTILGSWNSVTAALSAGARVRFLGSRNDVVWTTPDGKAPKALDLGAGNSLKPGP